MVTPRQQAIYRYIERYFNRFKCAPTLNEIAKGIGIKSRSAVHRQIQALIQVGLLNVGQTPQRRLQLTSKTAPAKSIVLKLIGTIAAGQPITAIADPESLDLYAMLAGEQHFALRVEGDSMVDEGIFNGDIVVCKHTDTADNGQIVVALIDGETATLKRLQRDADTEEIILIPANTTLTPQRYAPERVIIQGIFVGLIRLSRPH